MTARDFTEVKGGLPIVVDRKVIGGGAAQETALCKMVERELL